ncbi:MAG: hypothetical protein U0802_14075 [Candidatus Binatia bacterium]
MVEALRAFPHVDLVAMDVAGDWRGMFWRFEPASDPTVDVMVSRDVDSRVGDREKAAVDEWLASDADFHVMRDHVEHTAPVMGGMWGVRNRLLADLCALMEAYPKVDEWQTDQRFLAEVVLPRIRGRTFVHDEIFTGRPFPTRRRGRDFVGRTFDENDRPLSSGPTHWEWRLRRAVHALRGRQVRTTWGVGD